MVVHAYNASTWEEGRSGVQGHAWLCSNFEASLDFMRSGLKKTKTN